MNLLWHTTRQLAHMAPSCTVHEELLAISNHKENTIRLTHRIHPPNSLTDMQNQRTLYRTKTLSSEGSQERCPRGPEKSARNLDKR